MCRQIQSASRSCLTALGGMLVAVGLALFTGGAAYGQQPAADFQNLLHSVRLREALQLDPQIGRFNVAVQVDDRVAYLYGSVPSSDLLERVLRVARSQPDIRAVKSEMFVEDVSDVPLEALSPRFLPPTPIPPVLREKKTTPPAPPNSSWRIAPSELPKESSNKPNRGNQYVEMMPGFPGQRSAQSASAAADVTPLQDDWNVHSNRDVRFRIPIAEKPNSPREDRYVQPAAAPATPPSFRPASTVSLRRQILALQSAAPRYRWVNIQVEGGRVFLNGTVLQGRDIHDLAQAVARLPGVENVVIGDVQVGRW